MYGWLKGGTTLTEGNNVLELGSGLGEVDIDSICCFHSMSCVEINLYQKNWWNIHHSIYNR